MARMQSPLRSLVVLALLSLPGLTETSGPVRLPQDPQPSAPTAQRTVILLRHAEKDPASDPKDPALSRAGEERARQLARLLAKAGATRLIASEFRRTRTTLEPLAKALGLSVESRPAREVEALARELQNAPSGSVTVVAGHSNTLPKLATSLGAPITGLVGAKPELDDSDYDCLFVLTLPAADARVRPTILELRYGNI